MAKGTVTYIAPAIPALSETFVYNEIFALRDRGRTVHALSIHKPDQVSETVREKMGPVHYLYAEGLVIFIWSFIICIFSRPIGVFRGLGWLFSDMAFVGLHRIASYKLAYQYLAACRGARIVSANETEHIHSHFANVPCQIAMYTSAISGIPFTVTSHANDIFEHGLILNRKAMRAKYFVTISDFNKRYLLKTGMPEEKIKIVRCGVDLKFDQKERAHSDEIRICSLGRLVEKKGMPTLVEAIALLRDKKINVKLSIAGDGPEENRIKSKIQELKLENHIDMIGAIDNSQVAEWMSGHDMFVLACQKDSNGDMDGIPVVLMEAMMLGIPVISTEISGIPELVIDRQTGLSVQPENPEELANAILMRDVQRNMIDAAAKHVVNEFGRGVNIDRLEAIFNE